MRQLLVVLALVLAGFSLSSCLVRTGPGYYHHQPHGYQSRCRSECAAWGYRNRCFQSCTLYRNGYCMVYGQRCSNERYCVNYATRCY
ncbi:MAG: hypothetical protein IT371_06300 [Deltaproteobacteria bacterium]|nr:hypothetical protein [Deltaproteobacteria bacterium]